MVGAEQGGLGHMHSLKMIHECEDGSQEHEGRCRSRVKELENGSREEGDSC